MLKATAIGNLGNDPELRYAASGSAFLRFNVACNGRVRDKDGQWTDETTWLRVTVMGKRAETLSKHLAKGSRVYVEGRLEARPWTDQQGNVRAGLEVVASEVEFLSARQEQPEGDWKPIQQREAASDAKPLSVGADDLYELPF